VLPGLIPLTQKEVNGKRSVCFVSPAYYSNTVGGAEIRLHAMAKGLADLGCYEVSYLTPNVTQSHRSGRIRVIRIPNDGEGTTCRFVEFVNAMDLVSPDVLIQTGRKQFTCYSARYCSLRNIPFVFGVSSDIDCRRYREFPRFFGEFAPTRMLNPRQLAGAFTMDRRTLSAMRTAALVMAQTSAQRDKLRRWFGDSIALFRNLHEVPSMDDINKDQPPTILWLASMKSVKRPRLFLEICRKLQGHGLRVIMAGRMNEERFRGEVEELARSGCMTYIERVTFEESNELIAGASVFVLTSRHEGLPNTLIQAWLRQTPTVSLGVDPDGMITRNGLGAHVSTVEQAVEAILSLVKDEAMRKRIAANAREFAVENFGMASQARALKTIVDRALNAG
jgi:glycosyltransferase involved in cell wall biosynthesis